MHVLGMEKPPAVNFNFNVRPPKHLEDVASPSQSDFFAQLAAQKETYSPQQKQKKVNRLFFCVMTVD